jgi:mono/diheme cytochrome c family protein
VVRAAILAGLAAALVGASAEAGVAGDVARGRAVVRARCAACHAVGRTGDSPNPAAPPFRRLHEDYPVADVIAALSEGAQPSGPGMHRFRLPLRDARAVTAYIHSLQR